MNDSTTIVMGIIAMLLPVIAGRLVWRHFDQYCGRNDDAYQDTLPYFLKKIGATALTLDFNPSMQQLGQNVLPVFDSLVFF